MYDSHHTEMAVNDEGSKALVLIAIAFLKVSLTINASPVTDPPIRTRGYLMEWGYPMPGYYSIRLVLRKQFLSG
jgi:hypothetical protein